MKKYSLKRRKTKKKGGSKDILKRAKDIGAEELFKRLLYWDPNINDAEELHLYEASANNNVELVRLLLDIGADINLANRDGETPLYVASLFGYVKMVRILAERGGNINKANKNGETPLHIASQNGQVEVVKILLEKGANINKFDYSLETPLYVASEAGNEEVVRILLENGARVNIPNTVGQTPLMIAVSYGHFEIVEALLEYGANINAETNEGYTAFDMVDDGPSWARSEMANLLKTYQQKNVVTKNIRDYERPNIPPLRSLAFNNLNTEDTRIINEIKDSLRQPGKLGGKRKTRKSTNKKKNKKTRSKKQKGGNRDYVLYLAARQGSVDIVINMLEQGADINWTKNSGCTPLHIASQNGHVKVVSVLLEQGPDIDKATDDGCTPLYVASENGHVEVVRMLLEHGADINKAANGGGTPLSIASYKGRVKVVRMLLEQGADINKARDNGDTPLFTASQNGRVEMVRMLLEHGADIDKANNNGITPLMIAEGDGHSEVATLLKRYKLLRPIVEKTVERQKERKNFEEIMENEIFDDFKNKHEMMQYLGGKRKTRKFKKSKKNKKTRSKKRGGDPEEPDEMSDFRPSPSPRRRVTRQEVIEFQLKKEILYELMLTLEIFSPGEFIIRERITEQKTGFENSVNVNRRAANIIRRMIDNSMTPATIDSYIDANVEKIRSLHILDLRIREWEGMPLYRKAGIIRGLRLLALRPAEIETGGKKTKKKQKGGKDGSIDHSYKVIEKYKTRIDSENTNPFPYYNYYFNTIHELLQYENNLRRNNRTANIIRENTSEFRIIYMTLHVFLRSNTFVDGLVNENKIDDLMLTMKLLIPLTNESEKNRILEFLNQEDYNMELKLSSIREHENRSEFPEIVKEKLNEYKNEFISIIGI